MSGKATNAVRRTFRFCDDGPDVLLIERVKYPGTKWIEDRVIITREELKKMAAKYLEAK